MSESRPLLTLPKDVKNLRVVLKMVGGLGDVIIAGGASAITLSEEGAEVTLAVKENHISFARDLKGVSNVISATKLNSKAVRSQYDVYIDFFGVFANFKQFRKQEYYSLVEKRLDRRLDSPEFNFLSVPKEKTVGIHPNASNPNRRWGEDRFDRIAKVFMGNGWEVIWLGSSDEFGYSSSQSEKLSDTNNDLSYQLRRFAECAYFLGNDSGFCHAAGVLQIPGQVIFSATNPDHVIYRYHSLQPIHAFDVVPNTPTYSLNRQDEQSLQCLKEVTSEKVLTRLPFLDSSKCFDGPIERKKPRLRIKGEFPAEPVLRLSEKYNIDSIEVDEKPYLRFDLINEVAYYYTEQKTYTISFDIDILQNALRSLL